MEAAVAAFTKDEIRAVDDEQLRLMGVMRRYSEWARFNPGHKLVRKDDMIVELSKKFPYDPITKSFYGMRFTFDDEVGNIDYSLIRRCDKCNHLL